MTNPRTEEKLRKLASLDGKSAENNWLFYLSGAGSERMEADELIDVLLHRKLYKDFHEKIFLDPPSPDKCNGEYTLGTVQYPPEKSYGGFGLRENEWIKHLLIVGMTGAGKTNLAFQILLKLKKHNKPFLVFDWKRNYRKLKNLPELTDLTVFTVARDSAPFYFNPLIPPPGTNAGEWLMKLVDVIKHAYFVGEGVEYLLREAIDWVYDKCLFFDDSPSEIPMCHMIREYIQKRHAVGKMILWKTSAMRVVEALCFRHGLGPVLNTSASFEYKKILNTSVVLELDALSDSDKVFLAEALILWLYEYRKTEGKRETFKHALVIEEGHHILSHHKEVHEGSETIMETCLRQIREFGESVIVIDQEPHKLSNSIKANTYTKICFNLGNGKDITDMSMCMNLDPEEKCYIDLLEVGQAVVAMKGRVHVPLLVGFPRVDVKKGIVVDDTIKN